MGGFPGIALPDTIGDGRGGLLWPRSERYCDTGPKACTAWARGCVVSGNLFLHTKPNAGTPIPAGRLADSPPWKLNDFRADDRAKTALFTLYGGTTMEGTSKPDQAALRKLWRRRFEEHDRIAAGWWAKGITYPPPEYPPFPEELRGLACGAKTRAGTPCKRTDLYGSGRCPLHGGLSTGPTTAEGKARAALNGHQPKRRKRTP